MFGAIVSMCRQDPELSTACLPKVTQLVSMPGSEFEIRWSGLVPKPQTHESAASDLGVPASHNNSRAKVQG